MSYEIPIVLTWPWVPLQGKFTYNTLQSNSRLEWTRTICKQVVWVLLWAGNESPPQCLCVEASFLCLSNNTWPYFHLPACSFWITFPPGIWKSKQQKQVWNLCGLAKCEPASLLGKVLGKDILDNRSRRCQYSVLIFLSSATCFC